MKSHTNKFKDEIVLYGKQINAKLSYTINNIEYNLTNEDINSINHNFKSNILKSAMRGLQIDSNIEIPKNTIIHFEFGVKVREAEGNDDGYDYVNFGDYIVKSVEKQEDTNSYLIQCYDFMLKSMKDYELMNITYPITIRNYINAICNHLGLTFKNANETFANYNKEIPNELYLSYNSESDTWSSLDYTFRDVLDELAQVTASIICIDLETNKLELRYINNTQDVIDEEFLKDINVNFGEKFGPVNTIVLSRSAGADNIYYPANLPENLKEIKISDNQIMNGNNRADYLPEIYQVLNGLEYYTNDFSSTGICYYDIGDRYSVKIGENIYSCVMFNDEIDITQGLEENVYTDIPEETNTDYSKADKDDRKINQTYIKVDKQNGEIQSLAERIVDVSKTITGVGQVQLENAHEGILHYLSISGNISLLFPQDEEDLYGYSLVPSDELMPSNTLTPSSPVPYRNKILYPDSNLYTKSSALLIDDKEYELDLDFLNYMSATVFDEFVYEDGKCKIIRRVGIDSQGNMYALNKEVIEERKPINLEVGSDSVIKLKSFDNAIYNVTYLLENEYTNVFATQVDVSSQITQTNNKIEASVKGVADENGEITSGSILLALNKDESELKLKADKIGLEGYTTINGGFNIDKNGNPSITSGRISLTTNNNIPVFYIYGNDASIKMTNQQIIMERENDNGDLTIDLGTDHISNIYLDGSINQQSLYNHARIGTSGISYSIGNSVKFEVSSSTGKVFVRDGEYISWNQYSLEEMKKNIKKYEINALDLIKKSDVYEFHYKIEKDEEKKHIGFIIGKEYNTPEEFLSNTKESIDTSSLIGILVKAIQEQQVEIENLRKEMEELKNGFSRISK